MSIKAMLFSESLVSITDTEYPGVDVLAERDDLPGLIDELQKFATPDPHDAEVLALRLWRLAGEIGTAAERGERRLSRVYEALSVALDHVEAAGLIETGDDGGER